ncbi:MAG TPA: hypothetical protein VM260_07205, partial [Pirellula sp.]|nr:hypothetical protein [Pirellula sp.]
MIQRRAIARGHTATKSLVMPLDPALGSQTHPLGTARSPELDASTSSRKVVDGNSITNFPINSVSAQSRTTKPQDPTPGTSERLNAEKSAATNNLNTWAIFGFTEGADTGDVGERMVFVESIARLSRADKRFVAIQNNLGLAYSLTNEATIWVSASTEHEKDASAANNSTGGSGAFGGSAGLKYRILDRNHSAIGLAAQIEPFWQKIMFSSSGHDARQIFGGDFKLILDAALVPNRIYGAINFTYRPEFSTSGAGIAKGASMELAAAIAFQAYEGIFVGAEARSARRYGALLPTALSDEAWFL